MKRSLTGFKLLGALSVYWLVLLPGVWYIGKQVTDREFMTIDSSQREYYFSWFRTLLIAAIALAPAGYVLGSRIGEVVCRIQRYGKVCFLSLVLGWMCLIMTAGIMLVWAVALGQPGIRRRRPEPAAQPSAARNAAVAHPAPLLPLLTTSVNSGVGPDRVPETGGFRLQIWCPERKLLQSFAERLTARQPDAIKVMPLDSCRCIADACKAEQSGQSSKYPQSD